MMKKYGERPQRCHGAGQQGIIMEGVIRHHGRFAFLLTEKEGGSDAFLRGQGLKLAMDGDRVSARVHRQADGRFSGEILRVLERAHTVMVGILKKFPRGWVLVPEKRDAVPVQVDGFAAKIVPSEGSFAVMEVTRWPTKADGAAGTVIELLGRSEDVRVRITALLRSLGIKENFPKEVLAQSEALPAHLKPAQWRGRETLFHLPIVTIDGLDAKDFDDAVSLEPLEAGMLRLGVHIADVAHYVQPLSPLDKEAYARGTSVYLPDRVVPMLPPSLSNNLCSLLPLQERLTVSVFMDINTEGEVVHRRLANTVIRSCRRFSYEEVQTILDGETVPAVDSVVVEVVRRMGEVGEMLNRRRVMRGALDFELSEYKVETDGHGRPLGVSLCPRLRSHRLVEEFMLLANEAIATELMAAGAPFLHRRHDEPDPLKIKTLAKTLGEMGLSAGHLITGNTQKALQDVLRQAQVHSLAEIINSLIVRSMKQAVYSPESAGHFGIATRFYTHFTSPIRRYPDLMAHRAIKALLCRKKENHVNPSLSQAGIHCSERERAASEAEHKAVDIMRAELFKGKIGSVLEGMVTTVLENGSFVLCSDTGVEGMLRRTNFKPGAKVKVMVNAVNVAEGKIDLCLAQKGQRPSHLRMIAHKQVQRHK